MYLPLKQCNAMTIHKSQGATLNNVILDCEKEKEKLKVRGRK